MVETERVFDIEIDTQVVEADAVDKFLGECIAEVDVL